METDLTRISTADGELPKAPVSARTTPAAGPTISSASIGSAFSACGRGLWAAGLFSLALNVLMLTVPLYMTSVYDRVLSSRSPETLLMLTIVAVGALAIVGVLEIVRQMVLTRTGARLETELGGPMLAASLRSARRGGPDVQGLRDLGQLRQFISSPLVSALFDAPVAPLYLALIFIIHPHLGWITLAAAILLIAVSLLNQQWTKTPLAESARHGMTALERAQAQARNADVIRAMGMFGHCVASWGEANARSMSASDRAGRRNAFLSGLTKFLRLLLQIAVLGYGAYLVLADNSVSAGIIFAASIISARALAPLDQAIGGWRSFVSALQSWRRLKEMLASLSHTSEPMALPEPSARLSAEKLVYMPAPGSEPILKGLSFAIEPGEVVGIIGPSGAGKSTLARLLVGALNPTAGLVRMGGDDLAHWSPEALGPFIGYVPQDVELFPATVAQNIARLDAAPDPDKVVAAAKLANCHELIQRLPNGYDTLLGPQGHALSGGQRQRVALARAFYGRPKLVVLDEPNASLDSEGEQALIMALVEARKAGITCVVITQRTSVVPALTQLMVLREGRIEAYGPKEEVLQSQIRQAAPAQGQAAPAPYARPSAAPTVVAPHGQGAANAAASTARDALAPAPSDGFTITGRFG
jgi:PrtD family type I secretion system ABC transporter